MGKIRHVSFYVHGDLRWRAQIDESDLHVGCVHSFKWEQYRIVEKSDVENGMRADVEPVKPPRKTLPG